MSTITKEQLRERAREKVKSLEFSITQTAFADSRAELEEELGLARIALASLEAEPVAYVDPFAFHNFSVYRAGETDNKRMGREWMWANPDAGLIPVYTAPPLPVSVPDEATPENIEILASTFAPRGVTYQWDKDECNAAADSWNACRDAMLQGDDGNHPEAQDSWVACSERMPGRGVDVLACTISPIGGFEEIETAQWHGGMKGEQPVFITSADAIEPTHWMPLPAAPQQEVKP